MSHNPPLERTGRYRYYVVRDRVGCRPLIGPYVMRLGPLIIGVLAAGASVAALFAFFVLIAALRLLLWKLRSCPRCRLRFAFAGWELGNWCSSPAIRESRDVNGHRFDRPRVVAACRRCSFEIAIRKAPVFDAA